MWLFTAVAYIWTVPAPTLKDFFSLLVLHGDGGSIMSKDQAEVSHCWGYTLKGNCAALASSALFPLLPNKEMGSFALQCTLHLAPGPKGISQLAVDGNLRSCWISVNFLSIQDTSATFVTVRKLRHALFSIPAPWHLALVHLSAPPFMSSSPTRESVLHFLKLRSQLHVLLPLHISSSLRNTLLILRLIFCEAAPCVCHCQLLHQKSPSWIIGPLEGIRN